MFVVMQKSLELQLVHISLADPAWIEEAEERNEFIRAFIDEPRVIAQRFLPVQTGRGKPSRWWPAWEEKFVRRLRTGIRSFERCSRPQSHRQVLKTPSRWFGEREADLSICVTDSHTTGSWEKNWRPQILPSFRN